MVWFTYKNNEEDELKQKSSKQIERMLDVSLEFTVGMERKNYYHT